jgi:5-methyltetrahydropteroyltriglutamate--homocysteine methyltransferase
LQSSQSRILTTHAGALPRPDDLLALNADIAQPRDFRLHAQEAEQRQRLRTAVQEVVERQRQLGIDVVNDGEFGKAMQTRVDYGAWIGYVIERFTGFGEAVSPEIGGQPFRGAADAASASNAAVKPGSFKNRRDRHAFSDVYAEVDREMFAGRPRPMGRPIVGPVTYQGHAALQADIDNLRNALLPAEAGSHSTEDSVASACRGKDAFMSAPAPGTFGRDQNRYYKTQEEFLFAIADAVRVEYRAIVDAGFILQIDDPGMAENWDAMDASVTLEEYRTYARLCIEALNHALSGIPEDRVRYHMCWGSWHGPHLTDIPLRDIADLLLTIRVGAYSLEAGNVRHEHEWKVWRDVRLPEGKLLIPGVVSHATNVVEHPEVVADRIIQYARLAGRENVIAGTDCGLGGRIHPSLAWAKLQALVEGAALASRELWRA